MKATKSQRWHLRLACAFLTLTATGWSQGVLHWTSYKLADGLSEPVFNSVSTTPQGKIVATSPHAPLASELDGYTVTNFAAPPGSLGRIGESPGGQRWAVASKGLLEFQAGAWVLHPVREISETLAKGGQPTGGTVPFIPVRQGTVLFLVPQGLMEFSEETPDRPKTQLVDSAAEAGIGLFCGMAEANDGGLWITGTRGLAAFPGPVRNLGPGTNLINYLPPDYLHLGNLTKPAPDPNGGLVLLAESALNREQRVVTFNGGHWTSRPAGPGDFFAAWAGPDESIWAARKTGLFHWVSERTNWVEEEEISAGRIDDVAVEPGGAFWLATADGLLRGTSPLWRPAEGTRDLDDEARSLAPSPDGSLYFVAGTQLDVVQNKILHSFALPAQPTSVDDGRVLFPLKDGSVLVATQGGLRQFKPDDGSFNNLAGNKGEPLKALGSLPDGSVCLYHSGSAGQLDTFDGSSFRPLPNPPPLPHEENDLAGCFALRNGDLWIVGGAEMWWGHNGRWRQFAADDSAAPKNAVGFATMPDGKTWCATPGKLWAFDGQNWLLLQNKFNHINALLESRTGDVWLASNGGLLRFCSGAWIDYGAADGLPNGAIYDICEGPQGQIWAATAHGLSAFHPEVDPDPPQAEVLRMVDDNRHLYEGDTLNLLYQGADKWKYAPRYSLLFSHQTDQAGWSVFRDGAAISFPALAAGRHLFAVRAMDRNGNVSAPAVFSFTVMTPWFQETRLWIILSLGAATAMFFAAVAWHRHQQLVRSYAMVEQAVAERTRELEIATKELLHSQKMNALGTLAAGIAHDFNNILSIIKGSAQIIEDHPDQPEKIRTRVARIKTVVQQGAEIVEAMLGFSRTSPATAALCDINSVVADTMKLLGDQFLRTTEVTFKRAENLPDIAVSREFIQQILINFIFNAAEAMTEEKLITVITARTDRLPAGIYLHPVEAKSFVVISVRDQGGGMTPEIQSRIFEPFFTTKAMSSRRGTGLGLSMVYELARKMGAGLAVHSAVGHGSEFTLILPVVSAPKTANPPAETTASPTP